MLSRYKASLIGLCFLLALAWIIYRPGLSGPFLFDDFANLPALGATGPIDSPAAVLRFVTSGTADPTGRPVALLTFLADAHDWPAPAYPFKRTNLVIHLINGALLYFLLRLLGLAGAKPGFSNSRIDRVALIATACWLLHPLFVSTTLYVVQREAMLPCTFTLLGLLGWAHGRALLARGQLRKGFTLACGSLVISTLLAVLSKANGILLPALVLVLEGSWMKYSNPIDDDRARRANRAILGACCLVSAMIVAGLLYLGATGLVSGIGTHRPWTLGQRLLTEPRVLWDYLRLLWLPHPYTAGVFNDQFSISTSLIQPWTTMPAVAGIAGLIALGVYLRRRSPVVSVAIFFFLVGHSIESTTVPLELYFEHRNYLPSLLMFWPIATWLCGGESRGGAPSRFTAPRTLAAAIIMGGLAWMTHLNAALWGDSSDQAILWATLNPDSPRAQVNAAQIYLANDQPAKALARLEPLLARHPDEVQIALNIVGARCAMGTLTEADLARARHALRTSRDSGTLLVSWFDRALSGEDACPGLDMDALSSLVGAGVANERLPAGRQQDLSHIRGLIALKRRDPTGALADFNQALLLEPREGIALAQAAMLGSSGYPTEGLQHLASFDAIASRTQPRPGMGMVHAWILERQGYWTKERERLENTLRNDQNSGARPQ